MEVGYSEYPSIEDISEENDLDIEGYILPPSIAIAICEAAEKQPYVIAKGASTLYLVYLSPEQRWEVKQLMEQLKDLFGNEEETIVPGICHLINTGDANLTCTSATAVQLNAVSGCDRAIHQFLIQSSGAC